MTIMKPLQSQPLREAAHALRKGESPSEIADIIDAVATHMDNAEMSMTAHDPIADLEAAARALAEGHDPAEVAVRLQGIAERLRNRPDESTPITSEVKFDRFGRAVFWVYDDCDILHTTLGWDQGQPVYGWTIHQGDLHDGFSTLDEMRESWPEVWLSLDDFKAGRLTPIDLVICAVAERAGIDLAAADAAMRNA
jgi:hypothetical protein